MIVQSGLGISHIFYNIGKLMKNVIIVLLVIEFGLILHVERLSHVHAVQPYLVGIDLLVPEVAFLGAGLGLHLAVDQVDGLAVFFLTIQGIQCEQSLARIDIVNIIFFHGILRNRTVFLYSVVNKCICKFVILFLSGSAVNLQKCQDHAAINVIPAGSFPLSGLLNVPCGNIQSALLDQFINVFLKNRQLHVLFSSKFLFYGI